MLEQLIPMERYLEHRAARIKITLPFSWGSDRKVAYITAEQDLAEAQPTMESFKVSANELIDTIQEIAGRRAPIPAPKENLCRICETNGFPGVKITWPRPFKPGNRPVNPDGTGHVHRQAG